MSCRAQRLPAWSISLNQPTRAAGSSDQHLDIGHNDIAAALLLDLRDQQRYEVRFNRDLNGEARAVVQWGYGGRAGTAVR